MSDRGKLGNFLKEVINWTWIEFVEAEKDENFSGFEAAVFSLVRTCSDGKLGAIRLAIDRVDGKIETPVRIDYPKVWFVYPDATRVALPAPGADPPPELSALTILPDPPPEADEDEIKSAAVLSLRETVNKMADEKRILTQVILKRKREVEAHPENFTGKAADDVPLVKSIIAANLLNLAEKNNFEAITEVFDQIDGKLVETIRILGDDIFLTQYALEAPVGAIKNKDGIYVLESKMITDQWKQKFGGKDGK